MVQNEGRMLGLQVAILNVEGQLRGVRHHVVTGSASDHLATRTCLHMEVLVIVGTVDASEHIVKHTDV